MHMPTTLLYDHSAPVFQIAADLFRLKPVVIRAPDQGIPEFANAVFTDIRYAQRFFAEGPYACGHGMTSEEFFTSALESFGRPVAVDPLTDHTLYLGRKEFRAWLPAWTDAPPLIDPFAQGHNLAPAVQARPRAGLDCSSSRQRSSVSGPMPTSYATTSTGALFGGNVLATALLLKFFPYRATFVLLRRPRVPGFMEATTILTRGAGEGCGGGWRSGCVERSLATSAESSAPIPAFP